MRALLARGADVRDHRFPLVGIIRRAYLADADTDGVVESRYCSTVAEMAPTICRRLVRLAG
jgi:hypothetical protein